MMTIMSSRSAAVCSRPEGRPGGVVVPRGDVGVGSAPRRFAAARRRCSTVAASAARHEQQEQRPAASSTSASTAPTHPSPLTSLAQILAGGAGSTLSAAQQLLTVPRGSSRAQPQQLNQQQQKKPKKLPPFRGPPTTDTHPLPLRLGWAGSGLFFWWQLGAVAYLRDRYDLSRVQQVGASGGALAAALGCCDICPDRTMDVALELSERYGVWTRPLGLMGVWGRIVEEWLDALLPQDAHERCTGRVGVVYTVVPSGKQVVADTFSSRRDLIDCLLASAHVPLFLDFRLARPLRGSLAVDGSFPDFFTEQNSAAVTASGKALVFDYYSDARLVRGSRLDMLALREPDAIRHVMRLGYEYAHRLHDAEAPPEALPGDSSSSSESEGEEGESEAVATTATGGGGVAKQPKRQRLPLREVHGLGGGAAFSRFDWSAVELSPEEAARRSPGLPPKNVALLGVPHGAPLPWAAEASEAAAAEAAA